MCGAPAASYLSATHTPLGPDRDYELIALACLGGAAQHAKPMHLEGLLQVPGMIVDSEGALEQGREALEGSALGGKARRRGAPTQTHLGLPIEPE